MRIVTVLLLLLAAAPATADPTSADSGARDLYLRYCASCHGLEGRGDGPGAARLQPPPANLTKSTLKRAELEAAIAGGRKIPGHAREKMPVEWGLLFEQESPGTEAAATTARIRIRALADEVIRLRRAARSAAPVR